MDVMCESSGTVVPAGVGRACVSGQQTEATTAVGQGGREDVGSAHLLENLDKASGMSGSHSSESPYSGNALKGGGIRFLETAHTCS